MQSGESDPLTSESEDNEVPPTPNQESRGLTSGGLAGDTDSSVPNSQQLFQLPSLRIESGLGAIAW